MASLRIVILALLAWWLIPLIPAAAQEPATADADGSSEQVEDSDEAFRRRMELEDARRRDPGFTTPSGSAQREQEKIDALPPESRDNIRDQLVDIIMEQGPWEPRHALEEYPYDPTAAAREDAELLEQEQAAWDEQVAKYHEREAAAFGAYRAPAADAGAARDGEPGAGQDAGGGSGQAGQAGAAGESSGASGSYAPYEANRTTDEDAVSTAGAQQSALDFLRGLPGGAAPAAAAGAEAAPESTQQAAGDPVARAANARTAASAGQEPAGDAPAAVDAERPGIIAIEDLDKLEGADAAEPEDNPDPP